MTNKEKLAQMSDEECAKWLCKQIWENFSEDDIIDIMRYHQVRNFLKAEYKEGEKTSVGA